MKRINLLWTDGRDVHYPMDAPKSVYVESSGQGKAHPDFTKLAERFGAKIVPPRIPHGMNECFGPPLVYSGGALYIMFENHVRS